jgi:hypothetical protein
MKARVGQKVAVKFPFRGFRDGTVVSVDETEILPVIVDVDGAEYAMSEEQIFA